MSRTSFRLWPAAWAVRLAAVLLAAIPVLAAAPAFAHTSESGFVLLLPTGHYIAGGTLAVAASFLLLLFVPDGAVRRIARGRLDLCALPRIPATATSTVVAALLVLLLLAGLYGSRDPLRNPLPLTVWTLWWGGFTLAQALFGNLWSVLNPWIGPHRLLGGGRRKGMLAYPAWLGYWPAVLGFLGFAWFELVDPAPADPERLAHAVAAYWAVTLIGMRLFGERAWLSRAECFSVFLRFVAGLSPFQAAGPGRRLVLACPGARLAGFRPLPASGVLFVLLTLSTVSFDGLDTTFLWLGLAGVNPLEFPGRTALMAHNSLGLLATWAALSAAYGVAVAVGGRLGGRLGLADGGGLRRLLGGFVLSILPISIGYHFAHYLTAFLVDVQYAVLALADPLARDWNLLGGDHHHVIVSFLSNYHAVSVLWKLQVAGVVAGHVLAVLVARVTAVEAFGGERRAIMGERFLAVLMVAYTLFGLWLLASPTAG